MLETMYVRCTHCGYDNSPEYRFCGMCGASLAHPPAAEAKPVAKEVSRPANGDGEKVPVHGPSFLGLSEDPKVEFHYLYEDEQPRSHVGLVVFLLIILGAAGYLAWQWRQGGFPFNRQSSSSTGGAQQSASPSEVAPAMNQNQQTHIDKPMTGAGDVLPTAPDQKTQADPTGKTTEIPVQGGQDPATTPKSGASSTGATPSASESAEDTSTEKAAPPKKTEKAEATPPPNPAKSRGTKETAMRTRVPSREPQTAAPATAAPDADLELAGERYLYGTGVPQNCPRAESSLRTAAMHGNTKAQTVLGTMYATGHCVGHDLPTAYRWFARALHQDPQNSRISADLQVLWRQMTPQEKQLATASGQ